MKLSTLLQQVPQSLGCDDVTLSGLCIDSRCIQPGDAFLAYQGKRLDGRQFIAEVAGTAAAIIYDPTDLTLAQTAALKQLLIPALPCPNLRHQISTLAARFYDYPSRHQHVMAVTGTNGKSSIVYGLNQLYEMLGEPIAMIGTLGVGRLQALSGARLTTPDPITLQASLKHFFEVGIENIAMEASSHALDQHRLASVDIDVAIFTQLTRDHMDYHETMEAYFQAKAQLATFPSVKTVVVNLDCPWMRKILAIVEPYKTIVGYTLTGQTDARCHKILSADNIQSTATGQTCQLHDGDQHFTFTTPMLGVFNISNCLAMMGALLADGFSYSDIIPLLSKLTTVPGRLDIIRVAGKPMTVIDYAHTPDALEKALSALKSSCEGKLWCVFGAGGERDKGKRPQMGAVAATLCDNVILTDDNPRTEPSEAIIQDILQGMNGFDAVSVIHDRGQAIAEALSQASDRDVVLIAGKGHETYQILKDKTIDFCDKTYAMQCLTSGDSDDI